MHKTIGKLSIFVIEKIISFSLIIDSLLHILSHFHNASASISGWLGQPDPMSRSTWPNFIPQCQQNSEMTDVAFRTASVGAH